MIISSGRGTGKTTQLIKESGKTGAYIVTASVHQSKYIAVMARELNVNIPYPVTVEEILKGKMAGSSLHKDGVLVDEAILCLQKILEVEIKSATVGTEEVQE